MKRETEINAYRRSSYNIHHVDMLIEQSVHNPLASLQYSHNISTIIHDTIHLHQCMHAYKICPLSFKFKHAPNIWFHKGIIKILELKYVCICIHEFDHVCMLIIIEANFCELHLLQYP